MASQLLREDEAEFLASLEERILRAVELVAALRKENAAISERLKATESERDSAEEALAVSRQETALLQKDIDNLQGDRKQVRSRIEKLLGQMDALSAS
jgi:FtsZ-binding cell division protein ZapB